MLNTWSCIRYKSKFVIWQGDELGNKDKESPIIEGEKSFETYQELVLFIKTIPGMHQVNDRYNEGMITVENGKVLNVDSWMGVNTNHLSDEWRHGGKKDDYREEVLCPRCNDGGCPNCEPNRFM